MCEKIIFSFLALAAIIYVNSTEIDDVIDGLKPELIKTRKRIHFTLRVCGNQMDTNRIVMDTIITLQKKQLHREISNVKEYMKEQEIDDPDCLSIGKQELKSIDTNYLRVCRKNEHLDQAGSDLDELRRIDRVIADVVVDDCVNKTGNNPEELENCIKDCISNANEAIGKIRQEVKEEINESKKVFPNCTEEKANEIRDAIEKVKTNFTNCLVTDTTTQAEDNQ